MPLGRAKTIALMVLGSAAVVAAIDLASRPGPADSPPAQPDEEVLDSEPREVESPVAEDLFVESPGLELPPEWCGNAYPDGPWGGEPPPIPDDDGVIRLRLTLPAMK